MSWVLIISLGVVSLAVRGSGFFAVGGNGLPASMERRFFLIAIALLGAVISAQTLTTAGTIEPDARVIGVTVAIVTAALKVPIVFIFVAATGATAVARLLGLN